MGGEVVINRFYTGRRGDRGILRQREGLDRDERRVVHLGRNDLGLNGAGSPQDSCRGEGLRMNSVDIVV